MAKRGRKLMNPEDKAIQIKLSMTKEDSDSLVEIAEKYQVSRQSIIKDILAGIEKRKLSQIAKKLAKA